MHTGGQQTLQQGLCFAQTATVKYLTASPENEGNCCSTYLPLCVVALIELDGVSRGLRTLAPSKLCTRIHLTVNFTPTSYSPLQ